VPLDGLPDKTPEEARALGAATACLRLLENVGGKSVRQQLVYSQVLIFDGQPTAAERLLREMLGTGSTLQHRDLAVRNVLLAILLQEDFERAAAWGTAAVTEFPRDFALQYNLAVSFAWLNRVDEFRAATDKIAEQAGSMGMPSWLQEAVRNQAPRLASALSSTAVEVEQSFGLGVHQERE
jgi:hypothetical protein